MSKTLSDANKGLVMSITIIKDQLEKFLASDIPEVIAIKGAWGIGKTYSWNKFLNNAKADNRISLEKYSYVSLFGINSLNTFKYEIFQNTIAKDFIGSVANIESFKSHTGAVGASIGKKAFNIFKELPGIKDLSSSIESLAYLSMKETLICIDDLERKGSGLNIKDILGLVTQLKEQKKCKVVILLNDGEEGLEDYKKYREKVIDIELEFAPSSAECASIAYVGDDETHVKLRELAEKLDIKNIRVLKKIERLVNLALPYASEYEKEIKDQFVHSLTLFSWCHFNVGQDSPSLDFVTKIGYDFTYSFKDPKDETEDDKKWRALLGNYNYQNTDDLDLVLAEAVRTGYFDESKLKQAAKKKNEEIIAIKADSSFHDAWRLYHDTFENNQQEVIDTLYESFKRNAKHITPNNLNGTVKLFTELGEQVKASELIDFYIDLRHDEIDLFDLNNISFFGDTLVDEIVIKFKKAFSKLAITEDAKQVLERISGKNGWNQKDEVILANTTADQYYAIFKSEAGPNLDSYVRTCLRFDELSNSNDQYKEIAGRAKEALIRIASESEINRRRIKKYGIKINGD